MSFSKSILGWSEAMSDPKNAKGESENNDSEASFDDLEDAFFATGDAESFWDESDGGDPEGGENVPSSPQPEAVVAAPAEPAASEEMEPAGEFYNPSELHPSPDLIMDDETEAIPVDDLTQSVSEMDSVPAPVDHEVPPSESELASPPEDQTVDYDPLTSLGSVDPAAEYHPPNSADLAWISAAESLQREAIAADEKMRAELLSEAGRILLARAGQWEQAGACFKAAVASGLAPERTPKGYADVVASQGHFAVLRDLLVARGDGLNGPAAVEALQDAAIVERNHLKDDSAAVALLDRALSFGDDWFTLRLLREMHYRTQDWKSLATVLASMSVLGTGARAARCKVEEGRIREAELNDPDGAAKAYTDALQFDDTFMDAFLARQRVAISQDDNAALAELYQAEAEKSVGDNACFWWLRAARAQRKASPDAAENSFRSAMENAGSSNEGVYREAQVWFDAVGRSEALYDALKLESVESSGSARTATLLFLSQCFIGQPAFVERVRADLQACFSDTPECAVLAERLVKSFVDAKQYDDALDVLSAHAKTLDAGPERAPVLFRKAEIAELLLADPRRAALLYEEAHIVQPTHPFAGTDAARCWIKAGDHEKAIKLMQAMADQAKDADVASRIWYQISQVYRNGMGDITAANTAAQRAFERSSGQPAALDDWIQSLEQLGDAAALADGLVTASQILSNNQAKMTSCYRGARLYVDVCGTPEKARPLLQRCVELDPHCSPAIALLRQVCEQLSDWSAVYDLRRLEAGASSGKTRLWHLTEAAFATHHSDSLDPQTVALELLAEDKGNVGALSALERSAIARGDAHRLVGVYRRIRSLTDDLSRRTAYSVRLADVASSARDKQLTLRSVTRVLEASVGPRPYGAMARLAVGAEAWSLAEAALHADGDLVGLARLLEATSDDQKRIATTWRSITKKDAGHLEAHGGLERALSRLGSRDGLADTHAALADHEPEVSISTMHALLAGHLYENEETPLKAIEYYMKAFAQNPYRGKAFEALVRIHGEQKNVDAIRDLYAGLKVDDPIFLADALHDAGADSEAMRVYKDYIKELSGTEDIRHLPVYVRYEWSLEQAESWAEVFKSIECRQRCSNSVDEKTSIEQKRRWVLSERMADSDEAWAFYRSLHEEQPEDRNVLENLARIAGARGERELAIQFLDGLSNIAESADDAARYQRRIAEVHIANDAAPDARSAFLRALDHVPDDLDAISGIKTIARQATDWQGLVGILSREFEIRGGDVRVQIAREIAEIWEERIGDGAVAAEAWRKVIELVPGDKTALARLVHLAESNGDWPSFIGDGKSLVNFLEGEERSSLLARMGRVALQHLRREDEAVRLLEDASTSRHPSIQAAEDLEKIYAARGSWDLVVECTLRRARASEAEDGIALFLQAARSRRDQLRDRKGAAAAYDEALALDPKQPEALRFKGHFLFDNNDLKGSVSIFAQIEKLDVELDLDDFDVQMEQALYYFRFGEALRRLDRPEEAIARYEQALGLNSSHLPTLEAVGPLYVELERWDPANRTFRQVLQLTGGQGDSARLARVYSCLGTVEQAQGNIDKAVQRFKKALELQPNDVNALRGYASVLYSQNDWNNLLNAYNNIIYHAKDKEAFIDAYLMKGFVLDVHMSLSDKAAQHYEKSLSFDPSHSVALLRLAEIALRKDEWDRALSYAGRALSVGGEAPDLVRGSLMLVQAVAYENTDRPEEARAAIEGAQTLSKEVKAFLGDAVKASAVHEALRTNMSVGL